MEKMLQQLPRVLLPWYEANKRELPWRKGKDPYHIWVSEIMLQQTRVEAVKGYYARFLEKLPRVEDLANAPDDLLHKLWEGLGYYNRVKNMKKAAQVILSEYGGQFPEEHKSVLALPGIGAYTAGAICSICYDDPTPAVDGNVLRVISRIRMDERLISDAKVKQSVEQELWKVMNCNSKDTPVLLLQLLHRRQVLLFPLLCGTSNQMMKKTLTDMKAILLITSKRM